MAHDYLGETGWIEQLGQGWSHGRLLPIRVVLREFAAWLVTRPQRPARGDVPLFWLWLAQRHEAALVSFLRQEIVNGRALLLLDGLDEVPADATGQPLLWIRQIITALADIARSSRILVTCRQLDYEQTQRQILGWAIERLIPFSNDLCQKLPIAGTRF